MLSIKSPDFYIIADRCKELPSMFYEHGKTLHVRSWKSYFANDIAYRRVNFRTLLKPNRATHPLPDFVVLLDLTDEDRTYLALLGYPIKKEIRPNYIAALTELYEKGYTNTDDAL